MNTHLKGRIFENKGISYLVLHEDTESAEWVQVRAMNSSRKLERMRTEEVARCLGGASQAVRGVAP
ncbi:MAG: hypothetical protein R3E86_21365 [Pseudomonadales bacterium]